MHSSLEKMSRTSLCTELMLLSLQPKKENKCEEEKTAPGAMTPWRVNSYNRLDGRTDKAMCRSCEHQKTVLYPILLGTYHATLLVVDPCHSLRLFKDLQRKGCLNLRGGVKKEVLLGGAHHKVAYPPPSPQLWSKYHFFVGVFFFCLGKVIEQIGK